MNRAEAEAEIRSIDRRCRGALTTDAVIDRYEALKAGNLEAARAIDAAGRQGCGADFNNIIVAGPLDGELHAYECPACGLSGEYRAPLVELSDIGT